ncbi:unnamed protein product [Trichogramma brassicae]|uniref:Integrase catalytic domain-containing protein n=1 Tax=Trichogramma brassicae TaxID=86971 RepID=A0A6H5IJS3_9HYME|nr:unnamed protein product [Trichogramma brassicae]
MAHIGHAHGTHVVRILIDPGSEVSFVTSHVVDMLALKRVHSSVPVSGIGGCHSGHTRGKVTIALKSMHRDLTVQFSADILNKISSAVPSTPCDESQWSHFNGLNLADPSFGQPRHVDVLIGADVYPSIIKPNIIYGSSDEPMAQLSIFGWLAVGPIGGVPIQVYRSLQASTSQDDSNLDDLLTKFWTQEEVPVSANASLTHEEALCEDHFAATHSRDSTGRYIVRLPLKQPASVLGDSFSRARACLRSILSKQDRDPEYKELYKAFMQEYAQLGHMTQVSSKPSTAPTYYLPHHGVLKLDNVTTKLRVVFNGSAATSSGHSLNDIMYAGPNLLLNIFDVLIWIRSFRLLFATDITKMYRQILVDERDVDLQRIVWIDENSNETHWQLKTVTYGTRAAPYLAVRSLLQLVTDEGHSFPSAIDSLTKGRYVDDIFGGADSDEQLKHVAQDLTNLCLAGGFPLAKWSSNSESFRADLPDSNSSTTISLDDCKAKVLGLYWDTHEDSLKFKVMVPPPQGNISKRSILSEVAQIFDPLGIISPVTIKAKVLLQELWLHKLTWDEPVPESIRARWILMKQDFRRLNTLSLPRWLNTSSDATIQLHGFSDASQFAMSAVLYIRVHSQVTGYSSHFLCSKTKVAPLKNLSIPKLELSAAHLLAKLTQHILDTFHFHVHSTHLWTDSQVTLTWIKSHASRWKDFVRNRVAHIQELVPSAQWRHVPGSLNPADCASRGVTVEQLSEHNLWWHGPQWLLESEERWPTQRDSLDLANVPEQRRVIAAAVATQDVEKVLATTRNFSSFVKLQRATATVLLACQRLKKLSASSVISTENLKSATQLLIKLTQQHHFASEIQLLINGDIPRSHVFNRLTAFIDSQGIIRVGGRLRNAQLNQTTTHPAILPRTSHLTKLIIDYAHRLTFHGGTQLTLAHIRQEYWIIGGRAPVKSHILRCVTCARQRAKRAQQLMGQLPRARVTPSRPFTHTGIDYAGPLTIKAWKGRGSKTHKGWICVFVCFATSAVHVELVSDYSSEGFLAAFQRFSSRRGSPAQLYSDCGTNFKGAEKQFIEWLKKAQQESPSLAATLSLESTQWNFNPPAAPHMGGKWESVVKSVKYHLRRTIGETPMTFEELTTLLTQIERILNSRPLEPLKDDPEDFSALTPGHFLTGAALTAPPEPNLLDISQSRLSRWQLIQHQVQSFWKRWSSQYLHQLQSISKWHHPSHAISIGSLVLITNEALPPCQWPLARVIKLHPGKDGLTRVVDLKTAQSILTRPLTKLVVLPVSSANKD